MCSPRTNLPDRKLSESYIGSLSTDLRELSNFDPLIASIRNMQQSNIRSEEDRKITSDFIAAPNFAQQEGRTNASPSQTPFMEDTTSLLTSMATRSSTQVNEICFLNQIQQEIPRTASQQEEEQQEQQEEPVTPLPKFKMFIILAIMFCDTFAACSITSYVGYMVKDFNMTDNDTKIGYYAGFLASSYYFAQLFSSIFWGSVSGTYRSDWVGIRRRFNKNNRQIR